MIYICLLNADLLNYADDITVSHTDKDLKSIYEILTQQSEVVNIMVHNKPNVCQSR